MLRQRNSCALSAAKLSAEINSRVESRQFARVFSCTRCNQIRLQAKSSLLFIPMAPSENAQGDTMPSEPDEVEKKVPNGEQKVASVPEQPPATNGTAKANKKQEQSGQSAEGSKEKALSNKEKKDLAKAQKASRRAAEKQKQQGQPAVDLVSGNKDGLRKDTSKKGPLSPTTSIPKTQHKRTGSTSVGAQSSLPHRQAPSHAALNPAKPEKENKNVALFDHLYGNPRRTTIAGAAKDVNPSVLALGLQMRNYIICGSSARCVAMLLAFKRVGADHMSMCITNLHTGN